MKRKNRVSGVSAFVYMTFAMAVIFFLTMLLEIGFFILVNYRYSLYHQRYIDGESIRNALTFADGEYRLSEDMQRQLKEAEQWVMLLDGEGDVVWSYEKPEEIGESYRLSDIARMSKWYLNDYPVHIYVWDERMMVMGRPKNSIWKYNVEFPMRWMRFMANAGVWMLALNFLWILLLSVFFTRKWFKSREEVRLEWIGGISHDIRTPLALVMGYADALGSSENLSDGERRQMAVIRRQSAVMKELVEDLNLTSALEYSMQALRVEKLRPAAVLREIAADFLDDAKEGEFEVTVEILREAEDAWIKADRRLLIRAFRNLFHNSLRHSGQDEKTVICLRMWSEKRWCRIRFSDNGAGYPLEVLEQLAAGKKNRAARHIRGLGIVQKVVLAHGGKIRFENGREGGCVCEMRFRTVR